MARSNGDLIAQAARMAQDVGRRVATVAEAREMLRVPRREARNPSQELAQGARSSTEAAR
jgi:3-keto-5-aminohexanoate cleavage enzyme